MTDEMMNLRRSLKGPDADILREMIYYGRLMDWR
jgi:hypothetical protein